MDREYPQMLPSKPNHKEEYMPSTVVFYTEVVKLITSVLLVINESRSLADLVSFAAMQVIESY